MNYLIWYLVGSFAIGIPMGVKSINIWEKSLMKRDHLSGGGFWGYILFPETSRIGRVGYDPTMGISLATIFTSRSMGFKNVGRFSLAEKLFYILINMIFWLPRIIYNILAFSSCHNYSKFM